MSEVATNIIKFPGRVNTHFGVCPICKRHDGHLNVGKAHWFYCNQHKTKWFAGSNLFSDWQHETYAEQKANDEFLADFRWVK